MTHDERVERLAEWLCNESESHPAHWSFASLDDNQEPPQFYKVKPAPSMRVKLPSEPVAIIPSGVHDEYKAAGFRKVRVK